MSMVTVTFDDEKMVLVPRVPDKEMLEVGNIAIDDNHDSWNYDSGAGCSIASAAALDCWKAMIAKFSELKSSELKQSGVRGR